MPFAFQNNGLKYDLTNTLATLNQNTSDISTLKTNVSNLRDGLATKAGLSNWPNSFSAAGLDARIRTNSNDIANLKPLTNKVSALESNLSGYFVSKSLNKDAQDMPSNGWIDLNPILGDGSDIILEAGFYLVESGLRWWNPNTSECNNSGYRFMGFATSHFTPGTTAVSFMDYGTIGVQQDYLSTNHPSDTAFYQRQIGTLKINSQTPLILAARAGNLREASTAWIDHAYITVTKLG